MQHGEGRACFPDPAVLERVLADGLAAVRFVDDDGRPTEKYPFNPNGSPRGITALTLARRPPPRDDAPPGALLPELAVGLDARELAAHPRRLALAATVPEAREWCEQE